MAQVTTVERLTLCDRFEIGSKMKKLVVLSGAGMSAESGIPTFRGAGGLWEGYAVDEVARPEAWHRDPDLVTRFYNLRRKKLMEVNPNEGHRLLASLEDYFDVQVITQNIDNLHERAGSSKVLHLHGELMKVKSTVDSGWIQEVDKWEITADDLCPYGQRVRPHVVWFGESVPMIPVAIEHIERADMVLVIGTSMMVYPAAGLIDFAPDHAAFYLVDPGLDALPGGRKITTIKAGASEGMRILYNKWTSE